MCRRLLPLVNAGYRSQSIAKENAGNLGKLVRNIQGKANRNKPAVVVQVYVVVVVFRIRAIKVRQQSS